MKSWARLALLGVWLLLLAWGSPGCAPPRRGDLDAFFVRDGLAVLGAEGVVLKVIQAGQVLLDSSRTQDQAKVWELGQGRRLLCLAWSPGQAYTLEAGGRRLPLTAPQKPSPLSISQIPLESLRPTDGARGGAPDTALCFSADGRRLAIGSFEGYLRLADPLSGQVLYQRRLAEGMVKRLAWGRLDQRPVLYVGEQSPDCNLYCLDAENGREIWRRRLADEVGTGLPSQERRHEVYNLPGVYYLRVLPDGDLLCVATFGRFVGQGFVHDCRVYRLDGRTGQARWLWPADRNFPAGITWVGDSRQGDTLAFISFNTFSRRPPSGPYKDGVLYCLDSSSGQARWSYQVPPLEPYYQGVGSWMGVAVSPDGQRVALGLNDGRGMLLDARAGGPPLWVRNLGTPVMVGDIPVAAPLSYAAMGQGVVYFATPGSTIPPGSGQTRARRPAPHPTSDRLLALDLEGRTLWQHQAQGSSQGIVLSSDGRYLATTVSQDQGRRAVDWYGLTLFDASQPGGARAKLVYHYPTEGPVFFQADFSPDGRLLALTETGYSPDEGKSVYGAYRVHVIH